ncbi:including n-acetylases of ribosomal protein [Lasiosphaeria ovina]|uniref:Including n-acetylases of ribosomal protein n=1 Tax=Lasiosphaeria ovina TaxID=92902 RepID=A0AAE0KAF3_9PEZI|nr:including n-acetylases of ribosomal protein [Lasiosphaeria ovina]
MTDPTFHINTPRLTLSYLQPSNDTHCDFLVALYNSPEFIASCGGSPTPITSRDAARARLAGRFRAEHARNGYGTLLVSLKTAPSDNGDGNGNGIPIGTVALMRGEEPDRYGAPDLGFAVLPGYMRKGYATEAARGLLDFVAERMGVVEVFGFFDPANTVSGKVFRRLGFEDRGARALRVFGGAVSCVWTAPGMAEDLGVYGL